MKKTTKNNIKHRWVIGIDEAGRGPLAGPVYVGFFCIEKAKLWNFVKEGMRFCKAPLRDSKKLSEKQRLLWKSFIDKKIKQGECICFALSGSAKQIDTQGIAVVIRGLIKKGLNKVKIDDLKVLLDGALSAPKEYNQEVIIKGDEKEPAISLASIMAKVSRDKKMCTLAKKFPEYGFEIHKGYGTKAHIKAIQIKLSPEHRSSFLTRILN